MVKAKDWYVTKGILEQIFKVAYISRLCKQLGWNRGYALVPMSLIWHSGGSFLYFCKYMNDMQIMEVLVYQFVFTRLFLNFF
ncbi:hypothetical protein A6K24_05865 [Metabacillus litoralis]|uniref:Uncharacterized protein n=1 Tax=Metabacillus litoralis TaxID=152268 RepID=A0A179STB3_9BACI|nr:hypothetical protein A6K24_05865 [Metabacillus litoralis]